MNNSLNLRADALLAFEERPADAPFFREFTFKYKLRRDGLRKFREKKRPADPMVRLAIRAEWRQIIDFARLTQQEILVLQGWMAGDTFEVLSILHGTTKQSVYKSFKKALRKIREAYEVYPYSGLADVFLSEIRRGQRTQNRWNTSE